MMNRIPEFVGNHPILFFALAAVIGMIAFFEYQRLFSGVKQLSPTEATRLQNDEDAIFVDVRDDSEYKKGHILGARHIPMSNFDKRMTELEKFQKKPIILYCSNGPRASRAAGKLRKANFESVYTLAGGLGGWEKATMPISTKG
ncbi:sulfurtransferase [Chromatiales bacterium (ex Bugula neritina AB1)]|nr:sulfurtransferase [Chromatiales bacterium (ex Bugula neritina AB1)]